MRKGVPVVVHDAQQRTPSEASGRLLIVVGAHLRAEVADRPLAYGLRQRVCDWFDGRRGDPDSQFVPTVCCDIWYLNQEVLRRRPVISVGGPGVNALSAHFAERLTPALVRDDLFMIQLDPEFVDLNVCVWGMNHELTVEALALFERRYLEAYLDAVATQVEPRRE